MKPIRVLLVDDQAVFREGLRTLFSLRPDFEIVGEAADGEEAVNCAARVAPDAVLMDLRLPGIDGVDATRRILAACPTTRVIVLTTFQEDKEVFGALRAGAVGYLLKASPFAKVCEAVRLAVAGESLLEPSVAAKLVAEFARQPGKAATVAHGVSQALTPRERDVLRLLAVGRNNKEIGRELSLAVGTVKNQLSRIFEKLNVVDRTQAALRARDLGLLSPTGDTQDDHGHDRS